MTTSPAPQPPSRLGPYRVLTEIGRGGMGVVYRAIHADHDQQVAIKTVRLPERASLAMLRREIRTLGRIRHPGVIRILDEGLQEAIPWYAMELLQGRTFADFIDRSTIALHEPARDSGAETHSFDARIASVDAPGPSRPIGVVRDRRPPNPWLAEGLAAVRRLCSTLAFVHGNGIVHRDLKPSNILIRPEGTPVLTDFGLVSEVWIGGSRRALDSVQAAGTPGYMAPEQIRGLIGDARVDLYALGCILYELVTGRLPVRGGAWAAVLEQQLAGIIPPSDLVEAVDRRLEALILDLLEADPRDRLGHADDVIPVLGEIGAAAPPTDGDVKATAYLYRPQMVGRERLRDEFRAHLDGAILGHGSVVLIGGESGSGKTTLAAAVSDVGRPLGMEIVIGVCERAASPLHPFRTLLQTVADLCVSEPIEKARELLGPHGAVLGAFEPSLADAAGRLGLRPAPDLPAEAAQERVLTTLAGVIGRFTEQRPVLLILDDLQWADELSSKFLSSLTPELMGSMAIVFIGTYRIGELPPELGPFAAAPWIKDVHLGPLDTQSVDAIIGEMLAIRDVPARLSTFLARCSGGNPLFVAEYLRAAVDERFLYRESGRWQIAAPPEAPHVTDADEPFPLPATLRDLVERRTAALPPDAVRILQAAAVLGRDATFELVRTVAGLEETSALDAIGMLLERNLLEDVGRGRVAFTHDRIRETIYARLTDAARARLHRLAGSAIETAPGAEAVRALQSGRLAHHWKQAHEWPKAVEYLERAGRHALATSAYDEAIGSLQDAIDVQKANNIDVDAKHRAGWHLLLGEAYRCTDDHVKSRGHLADAVALIGFPLPNGRAALTVAVIRETIVRWLPHRTSLNVVREIDDATGAYLRMVMTSRSTADPMLPLYATLKAANLADRGAEPAQRALALALMQILVGSLGIGDTGRRFSGRIQTELDRTSDPASRASIWLFISVHHLYRAHWDECIAAARESCRIADPIGFRRTWEEASVCIASTYLQRVQPDAGLPLCEEISESARRGAHRVQLWALTFMAVLAIRRGEMNRARAAVKRAQNLPSDKLEIVDGVFLNAAAALVYLYDRDFTPARSEADHAAEIIARTPSFIVEHYAAVVWLMEVYVALWHEHRADVRSSAGLAKTARRICQTALGVARRLPFIESEAHYWLGECEWLSGQPGRARARWTKSEARAAALNMPYQRERARAALSRTDADSA